MAGKFYSVKIGRTPGIYFSWKQCEDNVKGYPGAVYKSFNSLEDAEAYLGENKMNSCSADTNQEDTYAFVDGSYNSVTKVYGYGGFLIHNGKRYQIQGHGNEPEMSAMRNVAGEVLGSMAAVRMAVEMGIENIVIYYDYMGIEMWATGSWKRNKKGTIAYYDYMQSVKDKINVRFVKVKGHSGIEGNEEADRLAKEAVGIL